VQMIRTRILLEAGVADTSRSIADRQWHREVDISVSRGVGDSVAVDTEADFVGGEDP